MSEFLQLHGLAVRARANVPCHMSTLTLPWVLKSCLWANSKRYASLIYVSHTIEIFVIKPRTLNGSCAWLCMHYKIHGVLFVRGLAIYWGL
jgi:hypothetical protein